MRKHSMPEMKEGGVNVTPLIDVVMCLIIFFMLVAKIGVSTGGVKMDLPEAIVGVKMEKLAGTLVLNVVDPNIVVDPNTNKPVRVNAAGQRVEPGSSSAGTTFAQRSKGRLDPIVTAILDQKDAKPKEIRIEVRGSDGTIIDEPLKRVLEAAVKKNGKDFSVSIRAQKEMDYFTLEKVIGAITKAGVKKINFGATDKKVAG